MITRRESELLQIQVMIFERLFSIAKMCLIYKKLASLSFLFLSRMFIANRFLVICNLYKNETRNQTTNRLVDIEMKLE